MRSALLASWRRLAVLVMMAMGLSLLAACGGGSTQLDPPDTSLDAGNATDIKAVLSAVPVSDGGGGGDPVRITYIRPAGDYTGWTMYVFNAPGEALGGWPGKAGTVDGKNVVWEVPAGGESFNFIIVKNGGGKDDREPSSWSQSNDDRQQFWKVADGTKVWKKQGDSTNYTSDPAGATTPDLTTVRVHYKRADAAYTNWGVHIWGSSGLDVNGLKPGVQIDNWDNAVAFTDFNNYSIGDGGIVFDIPVLNPTADVARTGLEFIIHGKPPGGDKNDKDGRNDNIKVNYAALKITGQVGEIWLLQGDPTAYYKFPDTRDAKSTDARAYWLNKQLIQFPKIDSTGVFKLYHSAKGQIVVAKDAAVTGADGAITLDVYPGAVPPAAAERFKYIGAGVVLAVKTADLTQLPDLHNKQLVLVQENAAGLTQNASTAQMAGALDDLYGAAAAVPDLGVSIQDGNTQFKLWAPTAQKVSVFTYADRIARASAGVAMTFDAATGVWTGNLSGDHSGAYYAYSVEVFVRGVGLVRNLVTDPYSVSLTTDSKRSYIADLSAPALKPAGWDASTAPAKVAAQTDMTIYELHVRDFSANDLSVSTVNRGKYLAFTETGSNGMKHLKALSDAGLTDVHLLPVFDIATVPEGGCTAVATGGAADSEDQQAAVAAVKDSDCFNWGYDPFHFNAPEGSYASSAADGARRVVEFRAMVAALHSAGLRVGMDVVYNHTTASGQNDKSVLDRVVPGYYHRYDSKGAVERSTCCDNTATENLMMGKLMIDSTVLWAKQYKIDSFRFDLMAHQPRSVMEALQTAVNTATGRSINLIGEGWNFGEVQNNARFRQASQLELNGSGIGTFSDRARDHVRGGGPFDGGDSLIANQGYISGLFYDANDMGGGKTRGDLLWSTDVIKVGLAGSIRSYVMTTSWDATIPLQDVNYNGQPAGYVLNPGEVVNYVENHDNQTLFDINAYKLPTSTSKEDRARAQILGVAINAFSQGVSYFHAGIDTLRSKSMDRNSYNSGDWFNRLDWTYTDNYFGIGLPPKEDNSANWSLIKPLLANAAIKPTATEIGWTRDAFRDLLKIRSSSTLLRLRTGDDIKARLTFYNSGSTQVPTVLVGHLNGAGYAGAGFQELAYFVNVDKVAQTLTVDALKGKAFVLHPVHTTATAADKRPATSAAYVSATGAFTIPPRTALVYVVN